MGDDDRKEIRHQLEEMLQELRVALPGVQMLFGFLLVVPFNQKFDQLTSWQRDIYFVAFCATLMSSISLIAPSAFHRIHMGRELHATLHYANKLALVGLAFLALALTAAVLLITDVILGRGIALVATLITSGLITAAWLVAPLKSRPHSPPRPSIV